MEFKKFFKLRNYLARWERYQSRRPKLSYAQNGEDILIAAALAPFGIKSPSYLDLGTFHPTWSNNTYYFYRRGGRGVLVEPNPDLFGVIRRTRPRDTSLRVGVSTDKGTSADYYILTSPWLNTFSKAEADKYVRKGQSIKKVIQVNLIPVNEIISKYFPEGLDVLSIDVEGLDLDILKSLDFSKHAPTVICAETLQLNDSFKETKVDGITPFLQSKGYEVFADTHVNTIYRRIGTDD